MTATNTPGFAAWLQRELDTRGWRRSDLIRRTGIGKDRLSKWLRAEEIPRLDAIRTICAALGVPAVQGMVAAGHLYPDDVGAVVIQPAEQWRPTKRELLDELARRIPDQDGAAVTRLPQHPGDDGLYHESVILGPSVESDRRNTQ